MTFKRTILALLAASSFFTAPAVAQTVMRFDASDFGKVNIPLRESIGSAASAAFARNNVYEPVGTLVDGDPLKEMARAVVRLDLLVRRDDGSEGGGVCTAWLVAPDVLMTNHHCVPGMSGTLERGIALFDYLTPDPKGTTQVEIDVEPLATDPELDYALVRLREPAPDGIVPLSVAARPVTPGERLMLIHHPLGQPKMMTRFQCAVHPGMPPHETFVPHICDTEPGTSGAPVFDASGVPVALHHQGGLNPNDANSFNLATALRAIAERHPELWSDTPVAATEAPPSAQSAANNSTGDASATDAIIQGAGGGAESQNSAIMGN